MQSFNTCAWIPFVHQLGCPCKYTQYTVFYAWTWTSVVNIIVFPSVEIHSTVVCACTYTSDIHKTDIFEKGDTVQSLLDMQIEFAGAQTDLSKRGHTSYTLLHRHMDLICAPTGVTTQVHTVQNLLHTDTDISCEHHCVSYSGHSCLCMRMDFIRVETCVTKLGMTSEILKRMRTYDANSFTGVS